MLQYLNIILDDSATSYCHYEPSTERRLISLENLKAGIRFAMKENLMVQFVYPDSDLPAAYLETIDSIDHFNIKPSGSDANVCVVNGWDFSTANANIPIVIRTRMEGLLEHRQQLLAILPQVKRLNVVIIDVDAVTDEMLDAYMHLLEEVAACLVQLYAKNTLPQLNILTDRMMLSAMNNCGAGVSNITLAPNGKFYVCPAFYYEDESDNVGDLENGLDIKNKQLYQLDHAPICSHCDAYQCKRCIWLNRKTTLEVNTPSHEQCVLAHLERNASRKLLADIRLRQSKYLKEQDIIKIDYLDPFDKRDEWL